MSSQEERKLSDIHATIDAYFNGIATREEIAQLNQELATRPEVAAEFAEAARFQAFFESHWKKYRETQEADAILRQPHLNNLDCDSGELSPAERIKPALSDATTNRHPSRRIFRLRGLAREFAQQPAAAAVLVLAMISGGVLIWNLSRAAPKQPIAQKTEPTSSDRQESSPPIAEPSSKKSDFRNTVVARLTRTSGAVWGQAKPPLDGAQLRAQQRFILKQGVAEIVFDRGATVILEGPAELTLGLTVPYSLPGTSIQKSKDSNSCSLSLGKLFASVPQQAHGFTVQTPTMSIVDLGTEFGVDVKPLLQSEKSGPPSTEVHVMRGEVRISPLVVNQAAASFTTTVLEAGEAAISQHAEEPRVANSEPTKFIRQLPVVAVALPSDSPLKPGHILAVSRNSLKLLQIDPKTGQQTVLAHGDQNRHGKEWMCVAVNKQGQVFVGTDRKPGPGGQVLRIDPRDGSIQVLVSGGNLAQKRVNGLTFARDGTIYAALDGQENDEVVRIDPRTGAVSPVVRWGNNAWGIATDVEGRGLIAVSDYLGGIARIEGEKIELWAKKSGAEGAHGVAIRPDGRVFVSATTVQRCKILEVDRTTHRVTEIISVPKQHEWTFGMLAVEADGRLILSNAAPKSRIYRVDVDARTIVPVASKEHLERVWGVAVVPGGPAKE